ncbi:MAG: sigma-70 family RNA polymerase sigma factor [Kiritimatiellae bacterium]|nr:sigma-70 family RNA polymerase sigma factor [Kiritimatiellia bacterium]
MAMESARNEWSYPETSVTLFRTLREARSGVDDAAWARFVDMYGPVIHHLVRLLSPGISDADTDEAVQDVFVKLVDILRSGAYDPSKSRFRTYLSTLSRRLLIDRYRASARRQSREVGLDAAEDVAFESDPGEWMDAKWRVACRMAAERRVMEESAISGQSRAVWRLVVVEGLPVKEAAKRLGIPANTASKIKRRIETHIAALLRAYYS